VRGAVWVRGRGERLGEEQAGAGSGKAEPAAHAREGEQCVIARIGPGGHREIEMVRAEFAANTDEVAPGPAMQAIFAGESGPGGGERDQLDGGGEAGEQGCGQGRGE